MTNTRLEKLHSKTTETDNYIVKWDDNRSKWVLHRKIGTRTMFMNSCNYQTPLIIAANEMEKDF